MMNIFGSVSQCRGAAGLATQVMGKVFPSSSIPGGQCIAQRRAHGVM